MTENSETDPEELLQQSRNQRRTSTEPAAREPGSDDQPSLTDAVVEAFDELEAGELNSTFGFRDARLVALLVGLERSGQLSSVVTDAQQQLGREPDPDAATRSQLASLLIRLGIQHLDADLLEAASDGYAQHQQLDATEY